MKNQIELPTSHSFRESHLCTRPNPDHDVKVFIDGIVRYSSSSVIDKIKKKNNNNNIVKSHQHVCFVYYFYRTYTRESYSLARASRTLYHLRHRPRLFLFFFFSIISPLTDNNNYYIIILFTFSYSYFKHHLLIYYAHYSRLSF